MPEEGKQLPPQPNQEVPKPQNSSQEQASSSNASPQRQIPKITLPKGGGAIKGIEEKFEVNAVTGTAGFSIPLPASPTRQEFGPGLVLSYDSGAGNSPFGMGWDVGVPSISRKTEKQLPQYQDEEESDVFLLSGAEDLVPLLERKEGKWERVVLTKTEGANTFRIWRYRPRIEGLFARIERWVNLKTKETHWRSISPDNVLSVYGIDANSRIADPENPRRIFRWFLSYTCDDKGNLIRYQYKREDFENIKKRVYEKNRLHHCTNTYLQSVCYGNKKPYYRGQLLPQEDEFMFRTVFDYGEYEDYERIDPHTTGLSRNVSQPIQGWKSREDAFSSYRAGFEIRTYRRCQRVLHFHCFPELTRELYPEETTEESLSAPYLVESMEFCYNKNLPTQKFTAEEQQGFSFLTKVIQYGHKWDSNAQRYRSRSLPPFDFEYSGHQWDTTLKDVPEESIQGAPIGIDNAEYQWIDLYNEGISGILTEQGDGWYYKSNLGGGKFTPPKIVTPKPSFSGIRSGLLQIQDLKGNGQKYLVSQQVEPKGFFELSPESEWRPFREFEQLPNRPLNDPYAKFMDLNGDGIPELIISEEDLFLWYPAKGEKGYDPAIAVHKATDEEQGPAIVFADATQSIFLADMSGDGMSDIVRIRNGEVCYWANMGYGRFGAKVSMENPPVFDYPEKFNPNYIRLADIDGSGTPDIIYLGHDEFQVWINQQGNNWTVGPKITRPFPKLDSEADIHALDFLGTGTTCIVWSSPLPAEAGRPLRYMDLMRSKKPHLMSRYRNNFGKTTELEYRPSTHFYLKAKREGTPWITRLPFPVHVLSKTVVRDQVSESHFTMEYEYHHGYYDYEEREFRGFGRVDTYDTEEYDHYLEAKAADANSNQTTEPKFCQPTVKTKTWFHTGAFLEKENILQQFEKEYFKQSPYLPDAVIELPDGMEFWDLSVEEYREALRACKSMPLRSETYALDDTDLMDLPYTVTETNAHIQLLQGRENNRHAVFVVKESETIALQFERKTDDPRIAHTLNLEIDELGNILKSASVVYPRREENIVADLPDPVKREQRKQHIILTENAYTNDIGDLYNDSVDFRHRNLCETKTFELKGVPIQKDHFLSLEELSMEVEKAVEIEYQVTPDERTTQKRIIEHVRTLFADETEQFKKPLRFRVQNRLGLPYENYQLAFTNTLAQNLYEGAIDNEQELKEMLEKGKFLASEEIEGFENTDHLWWDHEGTVNYPAYPKKHFYQPHEYCDPYGNCTTIGYDDYKLLVKETVDAIGNTNSTLRFNYRTLQPELVQDVNDNQTEVAFDTLRMVVGVAVKGKGDQADSLEGFIPDLPQSQQDTFFAEPASLGEQFIHKATSRFVYDFSQIPIKVATINRETHVAALTSGETHQFQYAFEYSNGLGQIMLQKVQAEPGLAMKMENGELKEVDTRQEGTLRWIGTGRTILNNKGNPVMKYEPYFSTTNTYEYDSQLVQIGVTPLLYYDPLDRLIRTELPNRTFKKVEFDAWVQQTFDANDTAIESEWFEAYADIKDRQTEPDPRGTNADPEKRAAWLSMQHANTPTIVHLDSLGRPFYTITHNKTPEYNDVGLVKKSKDELLATEVILDIEGNQRSLIDARGNTVVRYHYDMLGGICHQENMDRGPRWIFENVLDKPIKAWREEEGTITAFTTEYDTLHRPVREIINFDCGPDIFGEEIEYGEGQSDDKKQNLRGQVYKVRDQAGEVINKAYDFKKKLLHQIRRFSHQYDQSYIDWSNPMDLEDETFHTYTEYDALSRITKTIDAEGNITRPHYNKAGQLAAMEVEVGFEEIANRKSWKSVQNIDYDAKGQRTRIVFGNPDGEVIATTHYEYDVKTFRLTHLYTEKPNGKTLQDLYYSYDPEGNITSIIDEAQETTFFNNQKVKAANHYTYDALYQLVQARGRELAINNQNAPTNKDLHILIPSNGNDSQNSRTYRQRYTYDKAGNILQMRHIAEGGSWTRNYQYQSESRIDPGKTNNRLSSIYFGNDTLNTKTFEYNKQGSMTQMPGFQKLEWNYDDHLQSVDLGGGGRVYYNYDPEKNRIRKVMVREPAVHSSSDSPSKLVRLYLGNLEIYREYKNGTIILERKSLHLTDGDHRIALLEKTTKTDIPRTSTTDRSPEALAEANQLTVRYQLANHLGSAVMEINEHGQIISYEEYHPFGTSAFRYGNSQAEVSLKRYRYSGKEKDRETGLYYYGARYYAGWLGRWVSCDPIGVKDGLNIYRFVKNNSINFFDRKGFQTNPNRQRRIRSNPRRDLIIVASNVQQDFRSVIQRYRRDVGRRVDVVSVSNVDQVMNAPKYKCNCKYTQNYFPFPWANTRSKVGKTTVKQKPRPMAYSQKYE
jgi:RHS repeat-associated protein